MKKAWTVNAPGPIVLAVPRRGAACCAPTKAGYLGQGERTSAANSRGRSLVKTSSGKFDNGLNLAAVQPFEPIYNVISVGTGLQIFKNDGDGHARTAEDPGAAYLSRDAFDSGHCDQSSAGIKELLHIIVHLFWAR